MTKSEETMNKEITDKTVLYRTSPDHLSITSLPTPFYLLPLGEDDI